MPINIPADKCKLLGGSRVSATVCLKDANGKIGLVNAIIDTGCPKSFLFEPALKRFPRRLKPTKRSPTTYVQVGPFIFEDMDLGELTLIFRDEKQEIVELKHPVSAAVRIGKGELIVEFFDMILGLDFIEKHKVLLDVSKPMLILQTD